VCDGLWADPPECVANRSHAHSGAAGLAAGIITFVDGIDRPLPDRPSIVEVGLRHNAPIAMNAQSYSARSALTGSTWAARRAGIHVAAATIKSSAAGITTKAMGFAVVAP